MLWEQISLLTESYLQQLLDILNWSSNLLPLFQQSSTVYKWLFKKKKEAEHQSLLLHDRKTKHLETSGNWSYKRL